MFCLYFVFYMSTTIPSFFYYISSLLYTFYIHFSLYAFWPFTMCGHLNVLLFIPDNREKKWSTGRPGEWLHLILPKQQVMLPLAFLPYFYLWFYHLSCRMMLLVVLSTMPSLQEDCWFSCVPIKPVEFWFGSFFYIRFWFWFSIVMIQKRSILMEMGV